MTYSKEYIDRAEEVILHTYNGFQIVLDKGNGVHLYDVDGKEYLDFAAGIAVFALGYNNQAYNQALKDQIDKVIHTSNLYYNEPAAEAADKLVRMSGMSGLEVQEHLIARKADLPIIILTAYGDVQMAVNALKKGAVDFIEKPFDHAALRQLVEKMLGEARRRRSLNEREAAGRQKLAKLTPRERQVLERIVAGRLNKQIADDLGISIKTVEAHRASIMDKTASGTVADLMRVVMDSGERL